MNPILIDKMIKNPPAYCKFCGQEENHSVDCVQRVLTKGPTECERLLVEVLTAWGQCNDYDKILEQKVIDYFKSINML